MPGFPSSLDSLIEYVRGLRPDGGPLDHLSDAVGAAGQLDEQSDALIGYFVDQARSSGASWSQIGAAMGVSKQAAQKRFVIRGDDLIPEGKAFSRFTPRARAALAAAGDLATSAGPVDAVHLVAGSVVDPDGLAARIVARLDLRPAQLYQALGVPAPTGPAGDADPGALRQMSFTPAARDALREALKSALKLGHNYIGTEHLLLGASRAEAVTQVLAGLGIEPSVLESALAVELAEAQLRMKRQSS